MKIGYRKTVICIKNTYESFHKFDVFNTFLSASTFFTLFKSEKTRFDSRYSGRYFRLLRK
jgi:hypothetical protein